jgi:hypothetical protein
MYWVVDPPESQNLREMTQPEKDIVNQDPAVLAEVKAAQKSAVGEATTAFLLSRYSQDTQDEFLILYSSATNGQRVLLDQYFCWVNCLYSAQVGLFGQIDEATSVPAVLSLVMDYSPYIASDPGITLNSVLSAATGPVLGRVACAHDPSVSITTSSSFRTKVVTSPVDLVEGTYRVTCSYGWNCDSVREDIEVRIQEDSGGGFVDIGETHRQEPSDASGVFGDTGSDQRHYLTRIFEKQLAAGTYRWRLQWRSTGGVGISELEYQKMKKVPLGIEASVWDAYLCVEAVAAA